MMRGKLADYFTGVGAKRLADVEANSETSNQHEIGTTRTMREDFLGTEERRFETIYVWLGDGEASLTDEGSTTYYDAREKQEERNPEWRLYYESNRVTGAMKKGDYLFLACEPSGRLWFIVAPQDSSSEQQLCWLFGLRPEDTSPIYRKVKESEEDLGFSARYTLDELGIEIRPIETDREDELARKYEGKFPTTAEFAQYTRVSMPEIKIKDDPDGAILAWVEREWENYLLLEASDVRRKLMDLIEQQIKDSKDINVKAYTEYFKSILNRRRSRMGRSLEHHVAAVLDEFGISYAHGATTEKGNKPDFLFPSEDFYHDAAMDDPVLMMLGAKSTCKDRWRQVLPEAEKISRKHLLTLQPRISEPQTEQMRVANVQLVVPLAIQQETYSSSQQEWVWSVRDFIEEVQRRQSP